MEEWPHGKAADRDPVAPKGLPLLPLFIGFVLSFVSVVLAARLIREKTLLTWQRGPQMVGFSLAPDPGVLLFLFPLALVIWLVASGCTLSV